jgi:hypothetical protein
MRDLDEQGPLLNNAYDRCLRGIMGSFQGPAAHKAMERVGHPGGAMASASSAGRRL